MNLLQVIGTVVAASFIMHDDSVGGSHRVGPLQNLLSALSFEVSKPTMQRSSNGNKQAPRPPLERRRSSSVHVNVNHILHGTIDPEGQVEDVFYDAQQFGDGSHTDEFKIDYHRESVVLSSIVATGEGMEALLAGYEHESEEMYEEESLYRVAPSVRSETPPPPPPPPHELPLRFLRAGKGDPEEGLRRYEATLQWRKENGMDTILREAHPHFELIKKHYPHYFHCKGKNGEPCFFEQPPRTKLQPIRDAGVTLDELLHHYAMVTEFGWQYLERDDLMRGITVIDLQGIRFGDFVGEVIDYVRKCSEFTGQHYPERAGFVFVLNVPAWFKVIWSVVKPMVDPVTLEKIYILRGKDEIREALQERMPIESIPPEYGGTSMPLGESPEEKLLHELMAHNNALARGEKVCNGPNGNPPCKFCSWVPARSY